MLKNLQNISKSQFITLAFAGAAVMLLFLCGIIWSRINAKDRMLRFEEGLNMEVKTNSPNRGILTLNNKVAVPAMTPMIKEISEVKAFTGYEGSKIPNLTLGQILPPYLIQKKAHNDTIVVFSHRDTIYFRLIRD